MRIALVSLALLVSCHLPAPAEPPWLPPACTDQHPFVYPDCDQYITPDLADCRLCEGQQRCIAGVVYCVSDEGCDDPYCHRSPVLLRKKPAAPR